MAALLIVGVIVDLARLLDSNISPKYPQPIDTMQTEKNMTVSFETPSIAGYSVKVDKKPYFRVPNVLPAGDRDS